MENTAYRSAYEKNLQGLFQAVADRDKLEKKIVTYRRTLAMLASLCKESGEYIGDLEQKYAPLLKGITGTLTDEIRKILKASPEPLTTNDVRHALRMIDYDLSAHTNPLATINAIMNRLVESKEAKPVKVGGRKAWKRMMPFFGEY